MHSRSESDARTLTLTRPYNGIGDWLFALACMKLVNRQRPDVAVHVDFSMPRRGLRLPRLVPEAFEASDVRYSIEPARPGGMVTHDSLVYRNWPPDLYLESMVVHLNDQTGLAIEYEHHVFPAFRLPSRPTLPPYICMIGHGKRRDRHRKEWGFANLAELARLLAAAGHTIVQLGAGGDKRLPSAERHVLGAPFAVAAPVLASARAFIGLENGIMVLAGYLGVRQATIYDGQTKPGHPCRTDFPGQFKIPERIEPGPCYERIEEWLCSISA